MIDAIRHKYEMVCLGISHDSVHNRRLTVDNFAVRTLINWRLPPLKFFSFLFGIVLRKQESFAGG